MSDSDYGSESEPMYDDSDVPFDDSDADIDIDEFDDAVASPVPMHRKVSLGRPQVSPDALGTRVQPPHPWLRRPSSRSWAQRS